MHGRRKKRANSHLGTQSSTKMLFIYLFPSLRLSGIISFSHGPHPPRVRTAGILIWPTSRLDKVTWTFLVVQNVHLVRSAGSTPWHPNFFLFLLPLVMNHLRLYSTRPKSPHAQWYSDVVPAMIPVFLLGSAVYLVRTQSPSSAFPHSPPGPPARADPSIARKVHGRGAATRRCSRSTGPAAPAGPFTTLSFISTLETLVVMVAYLLSINPIHPRN